MAPKPPTKYRRPPDNDRDDFYPPEGSHYTRIEKAPPGSADWGSDGGDDEPTNGGMRYFRDLDMQDRVDRWAQDKDKQPYTWRSVVGPTPVVSSGDRMTARLYLNRIEEALDQGGWTTSEGVGLRRARKVWRARALGQDPRYEIRGNKPGGMEKVEAAHLRDQRLIQSMIKDLKSVYRRGYRRGRSDDGK